jgi:hypothetical protein
VDEQHVCTKFCVRLYISAIETLEMLREAFEEQSLSWTAGEDYEYSGQPSTETTENVKNV